MSIIEQRKQIKKNNIIQVIRENEEVSRYVLKKKTKYSMTTILNSVTALLEEGLITEEESTQKSVGRTPVYLNVNPYGKYFIGIEFNAERIKSVIMNFAMEVDYKQVVTMPKEGGVDIILGLLNTVIEETLTHVQDKSCIVGIGLGIPGYVDKKRGIALEYSYFKNWHNVPVKSLIEEAFGYHVYIDNNINAMAYHYRSQHKEKKNFVIVSMQYGVRLGIVLDGEIFIGNNGNAGEIGHTKADGGTRLCSCGKIGCLDSEISYLAIEDKIEERVALGKLVKIKDKMTANNGQFTMAMLGDALKEKDEDAHKLLRNITEHLGKKLATVISVIDIEDIIALNVCDLDNENFAKQVYGTIKDNTVGSTFESVSVECEVVDAYAAAKGAAIMILEDKYGFTKEI